jgi:hypothetical protein
MQPTLRSGVFDEIVNISIMELNMTDLACLAASSKALRDWGRDIIRQDAAAAGLLQRTIDSTGGHQRTNLRQPQAVVRLLSKVPASSAAAARLTGVLAPMPAERLVRLPGVPLSWARQLVRAGVRISNDQLLSAARSNVPGVEVWVQAQHLQGVGVDVKALMAAAEGTCLVSKTPLVLFAAGDTDLPWLVLRQCDVGKCAEHYCCTCGLQPA